MAECGKVTNTRFFFFGALPDPYLSNGVRFFYTYVSDVFFGDCAKT